jgi:hypothetical protein
MQCRSLRQRIGRPEPQADTVCLYRYLQCNASDAPSRQADMVYLCVSMSAMPRIRPNKSIHR